MELKLMQPTLCSCGCGGYRMSPYFTSSNHYGLEPLLNREEAETMAAVWQLGVVEWNRRQNRRRKNRDNPNIKWR
jgi:hypothetical protein